MIQDIERSKEANQHLPARMLNEFSYCPRLFYLEYVEGLFAHNRYTVEGEARHRRVDKKTDSLPSGDDVLETKNCLLYTSPSPRDQRGSRMPSSA